MTRRHTAGPTSFVHLNQMHSLFMIGLLFSTSACALNGSAVDIDTGSTEQDISGWAAGAWGTTTDLVGLDTGWSISNSTCVLSAVLGNLCEGGYWQFGTDMESTAALGIDSNDHWRLFGHGGAYTNQVNARAWANNQVEAGTVCFPYQPSASAMWKTQPPQYGVAPPVKLADLATNRRCFLQAIYSGEANFMDYADSMRVRKITATDSTHSTTGWYVEGTLTSDEYTWVPSSATGTCIDFPSIAGDWGGSFGGATYTMTSGSGIKMCGLQGVYGAYNVNSWTDGVALNSPSAQNGNWTMTVSANKFADAECIQ